MYAGKRDLVLGLLGCALGFLTGCAVIPQPIPQGLTIEEQVDYVHRQLTLEEKISLTHGSGTMSVTAIPEKGLLTSFEISDGSCTVRPELSSWNFFHRFGKEETSDQSTLFPSLSHLAQTWNVASARAFGEAMGSEARARGKDMLLTPGINLARTPLCGRNWEYMGEDPHLTGEMAVQIVKGIQSQDVAACVKHYALNSQEWNRNEVDAQPSERALRELYLAAFEKVVREGEVLAVMNAYNRVYGQYASHSDLLNNRILKGEWGFKGLLVTDWGSLHSTVEGALGGTDLEMNAGLAIEFFRKPLLNAVRDGIVPETRLDDMVRRMLYVQAKLHKLDGAPRVVGQQNAPAHQRLAREIAAEGMVLLKNESQRLPLDAQQLKRVVVVGQLALEKHADGGWSAEGKPPYEISPLEGLQAALPDAEITYYPYPASDDETEDFPESMLTLANPDVYGEVGMREMGWAWTQTFVRAGKEVRTEGFMKTPTLPKWEEKPSEEDDFGPLQTTWETRFRAPESGQGILAFTYSGQLEVTLDGQRQTLAHSTEEETAAQLPVTFVEGQEYHLSVTHIDGYEEGEFSFGWTRPSEIGGSWQELLDAAKAADAVLLFAGTRHGAGVAEECEGSDRPNMKLLPKEDIGIRTLLHAAPNAIVVLNAGAPVELPWHAQAPTLLLMSYAGQEAGNALADVLLGKRAPSGHLCMTWAERLEDYGPHALDDYQEEAIHYREGLRMGYRWFRKDVRQVRFPFGHGLTYTTFDYGTPTLTQDGNDIHVTFTVTNVGARAGAAVPQLYITDEQNVIFEGAAQLRAFTKISLQPGETATVTLRLTPRDFAYWSPEHHAWHIQPGTYHIHLATSAQTILHTLHLTLP